MTSHNHRHAEPLTKKEAHDIFHFLADNRADLHELKEICLSMDRLQSPDRRMHTAKFAATFLGNVEMFFAAYDNQKKEFSGAKRTYNKTLKNLERDLNETPAKDFESIELLKERIADVKEPRLYKLHVPAVRENHRIISHVLAKLCDSPIFPFDLKERAAKMRNKMQDGKLISALGNFSSAMNIHTENWEKLIVKPSTPEHHSVIS